MGVDELVARRQKMRLRGQKDDQDYFEELIKNSNNDKESLLQAFLFFNIKDYFPSCSEILIYENPIDLSNKTNKGKCDFVYLTSDHNIFIIETKYINTTVTGKTAKKKRNIHRNKVIEQVTNYRLQIHQEYNIPLEKIYCGIFTTDSQMDYRGFRANIVTKSISISKLETWLDNQEFSFDQKSSDLLWDSTFGCEVCFDSDVCRSLGMCYFDTQGDGD